MAPLTDATKIIILSVIISITALVTLVITIVIAAHLEDHPKVQNNSKRGKIQYTIMFYKQLFISNGDLNGLKFLKK